MRQFSGEHLPYRNDSNRVQQERARHSNFCLGTIEEGASQTSLLVFVVPRKACRSIIVFMESTRERPDPVPICTCTKERSDHLRSCSIHICLELCIISRFWISILWCDSTLGLSVHVRIHQVIYPLFWRLEEVRAGKTPSLIESTYVESGSKSNNKDTYIHVCILEMGEGCASHNSVDLCVSPSYQHQLGIVLGSPNIRPSTRTCMLFRFERNSTHVCGHADLKSC